MRVFTVILLILGFGAMALQDLFLLKRKSGAGLLGIAGAALLFAGIVLSFRRAEAVLSPWLRGVCISLALLFFLLEIYTVFFAVRGSEGKTVDTGLYAFCRHPGFWVLFLCLAFSVAGFGLPLWTFVLANALNLILILWEDRTAFPALLEGYDEYKKRTGFLFPKRRSGRV